MELQEALDGKFCLMPWAHLHVSYQGRVQACCEAVIPFGHIETEPLNEIYNGSAIRGFRQKLLNGQADNRCSVCYKKERSGHGSIRTETLHKFQHLLREVSAMTDDDGRTEMKPSYLDIRFSNLCNLRCRTCWHGYSSSWFEEAKQLKRTAGDTAVIHNIQNTEAFINELERLNIVPEEIFFAGGEPLISEGHFLMLKWLLRKGYTKTHLRYNTNLSVLSYKKTSFLELWKHFEKVSIGASIDAGDKLGEYIRKGLDWKTATENAHRITSELPHAYFQITPTVSMLNAHALPKLHRDWFEKGIIPLANIKLNLLERPFHYNIQSLRPADKSKVEDIWNQHIRWVRHTAPDDMRTPNEFKTALEFMRMTDLSRYATKFDQENGLLDRLRDENFEDVKSV